MRESLILWLLSLFLSRLSYVDAFIHQGVVSRKWVSGGHFNQRASLFDNQEDPEDGELLRNIAETYLMNKYRDCRGSKRGLELPVHMRTGRDQRDAGSASPSCDKGGIG